jgi:predicted nucleic-acid-binding protein
VKSLDTNVLVRFFIDDDDDEQAALQRPAAVAARRCSQVNAGLGLTGGV